jgi:uncharacterized protein (DUF488 family)
MASGLVYTVGHSVHPMEYFLELLTACNIDCLVDVRTIASSRFNPQYNGKKLRDVLLTHGIVYLHLPAEFGGRQSDVAVLDEDGRVDFQKCRETKRFKSGVERLNEICRTGHTPVLMCSEANPMECHRFGMISPGLKKEGFEVKHILNDKTLKTQAELEQTLCSKASGLFDSDGENALEMAYTRLNKKIAYIKKP